MNYTVVWKPAADDQLSELWLNSANRDAIAHSAHEIDAQLGEKPLDVGESREGDYRILCILPLVVAYRVSEEDRLVTVGQVHMV
jgi:mRNA-degrading endonuclease RelE of RelBE toxin-antitoxin system